MMRRAASEPTLDDGTSMHNLRLTDPVMSTRPEEEDDEQEVFEWHVVNSEPLSTGIIPPLEETRNALTELGRATAVVALVTKLCFPPESRDLTTLLHDIQERDLEWLAPLLLCFHSKEVTELLLRLTAGASPRMRLKLLCLHAGGFTVDSFQRYSVNSLFDISLEETNTLRLVDWFRSHEQYLGSEVRNLRMLHPFTGQAVDAFVVKKVFSTNARPMLIELRSDAEGHLMPDIITKMGDDLRVDLLVMTMFQVFNTLWFKNSFRFTNGQMPYAVTYGVLPFNNEKGVIEAVPNVTSLAHHKWTVIDRHRTVSSAIGCFIAGYMLGVRDRHEDNMLFRNDTMDLMHIDFGYIFNEQTKMFDAPRMAIPSKLKEILMQSRLWDVFVENSIIAWKILYQHKDMLTKLVETMFLGTHPSSQQYMVQEAFLAHLSPEAAEARIRYLLERGPRSWKRVAKNVFHVLGF